MTVDRAFTLRARWGVLAAFLFGVAVLADWLPLDNVFPLSALVGVGISLSRRAFYAGWIVSYQARSEDAAVRP